MLLGLYYTVSPLRAGTVLFISVPGAEPASLLVLNSVLIWVAGLWGGKARDQTGKE